jgi:hypothetical protein
MKGPVFPGFLTLTALGVLQSMGRVGSALSNAAAEAFRPARSSTFADMSLDGAQGLA